MEKLILTVIIVVLLVLTVGLVIAVLAGLIPNSSASKTPSKAELLNRIFELEQKLKFLQNRDEAIDVAQQLALELGLDPNNVSYDHTDRIVLLGESDKNGRVYLSLQHARAELNKIQAHKYRQSLKTGQAKKVKK